MIPARMFNMLPLCLLSCFCYMPWHQGVSCKFELSVEVNGKVWRKAEDTTSLKSIFGLWRIQIHERSSVVMSDNWNHICTLLLYRIFSPEMDLRRREHKLCYSKNHKMMQNKMIFLWMLHLLFILSLPTTSLIFYDKTVLSVSLNKCVSLIIDCQYMRKYLMVFDVQCIEKVSFCCWSPWVSWFDGFLRGTIYLNIYFKFHQYVLV